MTKGKIENKRNRNGRECKIKKKGVREEKKEELKKWKMIEEKGNLTCLTKLCDVYLFIYLFIETFFDGSGFYFYMTRDEKFYSN